MKIVALVPIKLNNERLPNKNTLSFDNGQPLISYILNSLKSVNYIDEIYVYCSNIAIKEYLPEGIMFLQRSPQLDTSSTKINEVISSFVDDVDADIYVLTHATAPFISSQSINSGILKVLEEDYDSSLAVHKQQEFMWKENKPFNYNPACIPRTQDLDVFYTETSGFYIFTKELFKKHKRRVGYNPYLVEVSFIEGIDIDDEEDFIIANSIFNNFFVKDKNFE